MARMNDRSKIRLRFLRRVRHGEHVCRIQGCKMNLLKWLISQMAPKRQPGQHHEISRYANIRNMTKTGRFRAKSGEGKRGQFGIDNRIYQMTNLSDNSRRVYVYLSRTADENGICFPFQKTIADRCSISVYAVRKALTELEVNGLLLKKGQRVSRRGGSSTIYQLWKVTAIEAEGLKQPTSKEAEG